MQKFILSISPSFQMTLTILLSVVFQANAQMFVEEQEDRNMEHSFVHTNFNGGGVAFVDLDNDGDDDAYLTGGNDADKILINDGNGYFTDITSTTGISMTDSIYTLGVIYGDIDNDGFQDLFISTHFSDNVKPWTKNLLFKNNGDMTFTEIWSNDADKSMTMGAVFLDYDLDGDLDIYNVNYVENVKFTYEDNVINGFAHDCFTNYMYRNDGEGIFTDVTTNLGLDDTGCALVVTSTDFDNDGDLDLLIGNDFGPYIQPNKLFRNDVNQNGKFQEISNEANCANEMFSMGIAIGDYDNDLDLDYYVSNLGSNILLENQEGIFYENALNSNVANTIVSFDSTLSISWGTLFADINNDMYVDLFISNGYVPAPAFVDNGNLEQDKLYLNNGDKTFTSLDSSEGIWNVLPSRGCAYSDVDNDGRVDIYSVVYDRPTFGLDGGSCLYMNKSEANNNYIKIKLVGKKVNRNAFGSKVYVYSGDHVQLRELSGGASFCSHSSSTLHFGVGEMEQIDSVLVKWTGGKKSQTLYDIEVNQTITIVEDLSLNTSKSQIALSSVSPNPTSGMIVIDRIDNNSVVKIIDSNGRSVGQFIYDQGLNIEFLHNGMYILEYLVDAKIQSRKIIKE